MHCLVIYLYEAAPNVSACRAAAIGRFLPLASGGFESVSADRDRQKSARSGRSRVSMELGAIHFLNPNRGKKNPKGFL
jgi:hypothetical protein